jgi:hypothetical protein
MREWLTVELLLGTLLVTTFTGVGLLALWVATSPRHWFTRIAVPFVALSPLLLIPAYAPLLTFGLTIIIVVAGIATYRFWQCLRRAAVGEPDDLTTKLKARWQFSIRTALAMCAFLAVLCAVLARIPWSTWAQWPAITIAASGIAILTLIGDWIIDGRGTRRERVGIAIAVSSVLIAAAILAIQHSVPAPTIFDDALLSFHTIDDLFQSSMPQLPFLLTVAAATFATLLVTLLLIRASHVRNSQPRPLRPRTLRPTLAMILFILWSLAVLAFPLLTLVTLVRPLAPVDTTLPSPNGYDELARIGKRFHGSAIMRELAADPVNQAKVDEAVPKYEADFAALRKALDLPFRIPIHYDWSTDVVNDEMSAITGLLWVLDAKADWAIRVGNADEFLACRIDSLRLAQALSHSGLLTNYIRASGIEGDENASIYRHLPAMKPTQMKTAIRELADYDQHREPFDKIRTRELIWNVEMIGWHQRVRCLFDDISRQGTINFYEDTTYPLDQAVNRLLRLEIALRLYQSDHAQFPAALSDLVPSYLPDLPTDPFASRGQNFRYMPSKGEFKLWSVGPDRNDDGGTPIPKAEDGSHDLNGSGDLILQDYFDRGEPANREK